MSCSAPRHIRVLVARSTPDAEGVDNQASSEGDKPTPTFTTFQSSMKKRRESLHLMPDISQETEAHPDTETSLHLLESLGNRQESTRIMHHDLSWTAIANITLDKPGGNGLQGCFALPNEHGPVDRVWIQVLTNFGREDYTCLYGITILGEFEDR